MGARQPSASLMPIDPNNPRAMLAPRTDPAFAEAVDLTTQAKYAQAEPLFARALVDARAAGDADRAAECMFWIGFCHEKSHRPAEARKQYDDLIRTYPKTPAAQQAAQRKARLPKETASAAAPGRAADR